VDGSARACTTHSAMPSDLFNARVRAIAQRQRDSRGRRANESRRVAPGPFLGGRPPGPSGVNSTCDRLSFLSRRCVQNAERAPTQNERRIMRIARIGLALTALVALPAPPLAGQGSIQGIVFDVEQENGQPKAGVLIQLAGTSGSTTVATTGSGGSATVPAGNTVPVGTQVGVYVLTVGGTQSLLLIPEGVTSADCERADNRNGDSCTLAGALLWAKTGTSVVRLGTVPQMLAAIAGGPLSQTFFFGPAISRNLEFEAFKVGVELGRTMIPVLQNSLLFASANVGRLGLPNDVTIWNAALTMGVLNATSNPALWWRAALGLLANRQTSEFASGSEFGAALNAGVIVGFGQSYGIAIDAGVQRIRSQTQLTVGSSLLFNLLRR